MIEQHEITTREAWLALRSKDVTASRVAALWGLHPYCTAGELFAQVRGVDLPKPSGDLLERGNDLEAVVAAKVARENPTWKIEKAKHYYRNSVIRLGATPDYYVTCPERGLGILQCKTVGAWQFKRSYAGGDSVPDWIKLQAIVEMMLTGATWGIIGVLVVGDFQYELHTFFVERDTSVELKITKGVAEFWRQVDQGIEPVFDFDRDADLIALLYPSATEGKTIDLRGDNRVIAVLEELDLLAARNRDDEKAIKALKAELREKIKDAEIALVPGWKLTLKDTHRPDKIAERPYEIGDVLEEGITYRTLRYSRQKVQA
jgi:predicted phage-related endonuclease